MSRLDNIINARVGIDKKYQFTLITETEQTILEYAPDGFFNGKTKFIRNKTYRGLRRSITVGILTFYKDGYDLMKGYYDNYGVDYEVKLKVEKYSASGLMPFVTLKLDLASYSETGIAVKVQAVDSSFIEKIKNREDVKVNLLSEKAIDGGAITPINETLHLTSTAIHNEAHWSYATITLTDPQHIVRSTLLNSTFGSDVVTPDVSAQFRSGNGGFVNNSLKTRRVTIDVALTAELSNNQSHETGITGHYGVQLNLYNSDKILLQQITSKEFLDTDRVDIDWSYTGDVVMNVGDSLVLEAEYWIDGSYLDDWSILYSSLTQSMVEDVKGLTERDIKAIGIWEAFYRLVEILTGETAFDSVMFGRTDTPVIYPNDGVLLHLTKGRYLRDNTPSPFPVSFKDLFLSVNAVYNIGMAIEDGKVKIEGITYFYNDTIVLDVSDRITPEILTKSVTPDKIYKTIQVGFEKFGNSKGNTDNAWLEFNTKATYTTEMKSVTSSLVILSKVRADGTAIFRLANDNDLSKQASGDNDLFFIKTVRDGTIHEATDEGYTMISGSVYANKSLNLDLSPARSLFRWGNIIKAGLRDGIIRWQNTDNNYQLSTQKTGGDVVKEDADINYSELGASLFEPEQFKFEIPLSDAEINSIFENPYGLIKIGETESGWIDSLVINNSNNMTTFILTRK